MAAPEGDSFVIISPEFTLSDAWSIFCHQESFHLRESDIKHALQPDKSMIRINFKRSLKPPKKGCLLVRVDVPELALKNYVLFKAPFDLRDAEPWRAEEKTREFKVDLFVNMLDSPAEQEEDEESDSESSSSSYEEELSEDNKRLRTEKDEEEEDESQERKRREQYKLKRRVKCFSTKNSKIELKDADEPGARATLRLGHDINYDTILTNWEFFVDAKVLLELVEKGKKYAEKVQNELLKLDSMKIDE